MALYKSNTTSLNFAAMHEKNKEINCSAYHVEYLKSSLNINVNVKEQLHAHVVSNTLLFQNVYFLIEIEGCISEKIYKSKFFYFLNLRAS